MKCKVSIHHCKDVYNITFFDDHNDFYGKDIDITARLLSKAKENSIVISEVFYQAVLNDSNKSGEKSNMGYLKNISGTYIEDFKGIPSLTEFRCLN